MQKLSPGTLQLSKRMLRLVRQRPAPARRAIYCHIFSCVEAGISKELSDLLELLPGVTIAYYRTVEPSVLACLEASANFASSCSEDALHQRL